MATNPTEQRKIALGVEYDGSHYFGWQKQQSVSSIQETVENALSKIANHPITIYCAGRTDAGVHATGQVIHFVTDAKRNIDAWVMGTNTYLPDSIAIRWSKSVSMDFHARYSATARRYRYIINNAKTRSAILSKGITHCHSPLNADLMHEAAQALLGENDFTTFRAAQCQSLSPWRNIHHINVTRQASFIIVDIKANAFVHHMVRNIVGSLIEVGAGKQTVFWIADILEKKDRTLAAATAKAAGLYLIEVDYPANYGIPKQVADPIFFNC